MKVMIQWFTIHNLPFYQIVQELFSSLISHKKQSSFFFFFLVFNIEKEFFLVIGDKLICHKLLKSNSIFI